MNENLTLQKVLRNSFGLKIFFPVSSFVFDLFYRYPLQKCKDHVHLKILTRV